MFINVPCFSITVLHNSKKFLPNQSASLVKKKLAREATKFSLYRLQRLNEFAQMRWGASHELSISFSRTDKNFVMLKFPLFSSSFRVFITESLLRSPLESFHQGHLRSHRNAVRKFVRIKIREFSCTSDCKTRTPKQAFKTELLLKRPWRAGVRKGQTHGTF